MRHPSRHPVSGFGLRCDLRPWCCAALLVALAACARQQPVLYPNAHYQQVGRQAADLDVDTCMRLADVYVGNRSPVEETAKNAGTGAIIGTATGAAVGAVVGRPGRGAAAGAAGGGAGGFARGILRSRKNDPIFQRYVERCLRDRGYDTIGWR
jgi:uncharacterized protein YcfJ